MAFKKEAKKPAAKKPAPKPEAPESYAKSTVSTAEDIHSIYTLLAKLDAKVDELTDRCNAAVEAITTVPPEAIQQEKERAEDEDRGVCNACGERMNPENSSVTPSGRVVHTSCKVQPLEAPPKPPKAKAEPKPAVPTLEALRVAVQGYVERHGREAAESLLNEAGYSKVSEVPEAERADAIEAFSG